MIRTRNFFPASIALGILLFSLQGLDSQEAPATSPEPEGIYRYFDVEPGLRLWGASVDLGLGLRIFEGVDSGIWTRFSGAWETVSYYQDSTGAFVKASEGIPLDTGETDYSRWDFKGGAGLFQGLHYDEKKKRNDLGVLAAWMYQYDILDPSLAASSWLGASSGQIIQEGGLSFFLIDLAYDGVNSREATKIKDGVFLEVFGEWGPEGFYSASPDSWARTGLVFKAFVPVFETTASHAAAGVDKAEDWNSFSGYLGFHVLADQLFNLGTDPLPHQVRNITGGTDYRYGLGGLVRGFNDGYLAGTTKVSGNIEFRVNGPAFLHKDLMPIFFAYLDGGLSYGDDSGLETAFGTGLGIFVDVFGFGQLGLYTKLAFGQVNEDGAYWIPVDIGFGLHF